MKKALGSLLLSSLVLFLAPSPAQADTFVLCPNAAAQGGFGNSFTDVPGPLDSTCGANSAVTMGVSIPTNYAKLTFSPATAGYPPGLTLGNLAGMSADVSGDQPYYELAFTDSTDALGQTLSTDQILMIEFQPSTVSGGILGLDPNVTQFNLYDNTQGSYLEGGQGDTNSLDGWLGADPFLAGDALQEVRIGLGLAGGGSNPLSVTVNSLDITENTTPEPGTLLLLGTGLLGIGRFVRRKIAA